MLHIFISILMLIMVGCSDTSDEVELNNLPTQPTEYSLSCLRWVDRKLYFATPDAIIANKNK